ncbi:MAG: zonular occludens toxin domain-containing protein, partial [Gammaproteobacteria bacterium]
HVHYLRPWNMKGARYTWDTVQNDPTTKTAKKAGQRELVTPNPKVFELYTSTVLDTHKARPPWKLIAFGVAALVLLIGGTSLAVYQLRHMNDKAPTPPELQASVNPDPGVIAKAAQSIPQTEGWSAETIKPRIEGLSWTAPVYDQLTAPSDFPRVSACMYAKRTGCTCYTQQATRLDVPEAACLVYVKEGSFDPWLSSRKTVSASPERSQAVLPDSAVPAVPPARSSAASIFTVVNSGKPGLLW